MSLDRKGFPFTEELEPSEHIRYNHVLLETPLGVVSIEWKGWKEYDPYTIYLDGEYLKNEASLGEAKNFVVDFLYSKHKELGIFIATHDKNPFVFPLT